MLSIDDIELNEWAVNNKFARFWYCWDLCNCSILKIAIKKAIHKSPHDVQQRHLFPDKDDGQEIQFLGFVSSHRTGNVLHSFHIVSFAVFYTDEKESTIVTCILTSRNHIGKNFRIPTFRPSIFLNAAPPKTNQGYLPWSLSHLSHLFCFLFARKTFPTSI